MKRKFTILALMIFSAPLLVAGVNLGLFFGGYEVDTSSLDQASDGNSILVTVSGGKKTITAGTATAAPTGAAGGDLAGTYPNPTISTVSTPTVQGLTVTQSVSVTGPIGATVLHTDTIDPTGTAVLVTKDLDVTGNTSVTDGLSAVFLTGDGRGITNVQHTTLSEIGTNTHADIDTHIADTANPHGTTLDNLGAHSTTNPVSLTSTAGLSGAFVTAGFIGNSDGTTVFKGDGSQIVGLGSTVTTAGAVSGDGSGGDPVTIASGAIGATEVGANAIGLSEMADDAVGLAEMAHGTAGNLITYSAAGAPAAVATGTTGHFLRSAGAGAAPAFAAISVSGAISGNGSAGTPLTIASGAIGATEIGANAIGNSEMADDAIGLAELASGTDGELITWDSSGNPATVTVGTSGQVLTSNGAGAAPTFQAAPFGGVAGPGIQISGTTVSVTGSLIQVVESSYVAVQTGTTTIPWDDTIPTSTEGDEFMTLQMNPVSASSKLEIEVHMCVGSSNDQYIITGALFKGASSSAMAAAAVSPSGSNSTNVLVIHATEASGSTAIRTYRVRAGLHVSGTCTLNGGGGVRKLGGALVSKIIIKEWYP